MDLYDSIDNLKGIGPKTKNMLNKSSIFSILDLLLYFPRDYERYDICSDINKSSESEKIIIKAKVVKILRDYVSSNRRTITTIIFNDGTKNFKGKWFNQPYIKSNFIVSHEYILSGRLQNYNGQLFLNNPKVISKEQHQDDLGYDAKNLEIQPVYVLKNGMTNNLLKKLVSQILDNIAVEENLPESLIKKYKLISLDSAIRNIHMPSDTDTLEKAEYRLKFQELLTYCSKILFLKEYLKEKNEGISFKISAQLIKLKNDLGFTLTDAQSRAIREILIDEKKAAPMNRLLQGDVGSGKTIVALISVFNVIMNGYQAAIMAPTEILAEQHYEEAKRLFKNYNINIRLLCGSTSNKEKDEIKNALHTGEIQLIIGTHALFQEDVKFYRLGMVVTDEQHRFGVNQRAKLFSKGKNIDILVMTATPIPRTMALYLYGDLDISVIDELPPGRQKIDTYYIDYKQRSRAYKFALKEIINGRQVYIVCPLIEENEDLGLSSLEKLYEELTKKYFQDISIGILHGKMNSKEKESIMNQFKDGIIKLLISTTVIEVGINVPNASLMIIMNAERFGLAQLHQLRGRVGRGTNKSYCILIADIKSEITRKRLEILKNSNDGFYIAEEDLKLRGSGELLGLRQHGENGLLLSDPQEDFPLLKAANSEAKRILISDNKEDKEYIIRLKKILEKTSGFICFN